MKPTQEILDAIKRLEAEGRVTYTGVGPLDGPPAGSTPGRQESEAAFQQRVIDLAHQHGWLVASFRPARVLRNGVEKYETPVGADGRGWPDLVLVRDRVIFAELKSDKGPLRPDQEKWGEWLDDADAEYWVWRPKLWPEIVEALT